MAEDPTLPLAVGGMVITVFGWLLRREVSRNDKYGERIEVLEKTIPSLVKHSDLQTTEKTIIDAIKDLKGELRDERDRINRLAERH